MRLLRLINLWTPFGANRRRGLRELVGHILAADARLAALVTGRIYYAAIPCDETRGAIAYQVIGRDTPGDLDGPDATGSALVQVATIGRDADEVEQITDTLRSVFDGFEGAILGWTIHDIHITGERDTWSQPADNSDTGTLRTILDFRLLYSSP